MERIGLDFSMQNWGTKHPQVDKNNSKSQVCGREWEPTTANLGEKGRKIFAKTEVKKRGGGGEMSFFARPPKGQLSAAGCGSAAEI